MGLMSILEELYREKLVIIARRIPVDKIGLCAQAIYNGGVRFMESTFDASNPNCVEENCKCIKEIAKAAGGKLHVGAGTVLNVEQVRAAYDAGAEYIISPNTDEEVITETKRLGMLSLPGAMTPSEIVKAYNAGADIVKLFPADDVGMHFIKNLAGPLGHIPLMATGGVNPQSIPQLYKLGIRAFGTGITVLRPKLVETEDYESIRRLADEHTAAIRSLS